VVRHEAWRTSATPSGRYSYLLDQVGLRYAVDEIVSPIVSAPLLEHSVETRERILKAAERLFADRGYEETSIRAIVAKARVNQAAINYHFGGKDGLYREVLRTAFRALTKQQLAHAQEMKDMSRENALGEFIRHQLHPLGDYGRCLASGSVRHFWTKPPCSGNARSVSSWDRDPQLTHAGTRAHSKHVHFEVRGTGAA
jgi:Bacterial regulatory proteins, tetR family